MSGHLSGHLLKRHRPDEPSPLVRAGFVVVLVPVSVPGFRLVLARGWHGAQSVAPGGGLVGMADYMERCVLPDSDEDSPAMDSYRDQIINVMNRYFAPEWAARASAWLRDLQSPAERMDVAGRLRDRQLALLEAAAEFGELSKAIMESAE